MSARGGGRGREGEVGEEELARLEEVARQAGQGETPWERSQSAERLVNAATGALLPLVAEVRRLRAEREELLTDDQAYWRYGFSYQS